MNAHNYWSFMNRNSGCRRERPLLLGSWQRRPSSAFWWPRDCQDWLREILCAIPQRYQPLLHVCIMTWVTIACFLCSGCFFTTSGGLQSFEHPLNEMKAMPIVDGQGQICSATYKVDAESKKCYGIQRVDSAANWSSQYWCNDVKPLRFSGDYSGEINEVSIHCFWQSFGHIT